MLDPPGKSVFFNDRLGLLFVRATEQDLDTIERAIDALNQVAPEVQIKARFIEVDQTDNNALGFDWYLGNFINGAVVANGGTAGSLYTGSQTAANPTGFFPGTSASTLIAPSATDQQIGNLTSANSGIPTLATVTGILTDPNFRVVLHALEERSGSENLGEPMAVTTSGRQTQMRATQIINVESGFTFTAGTSATTTTGGGGALP